MNETKAEKYTTDKNGFFKLKESKEYRDFLLQIKYNNDELFMEDDEDYNTYNSYTPATETKTLSACFSSF